MRHWFSFGDNKVELLGPPEISYDDSDGKPLSLGRSGGIKITGFEPTEPALGERLHEMLVEEWTSIVRGMLMETARHEAGHAVVAIELGVGVTRARIFESAGGFSGDVQIHAAKVDLDWQPGMPEMDYPNRLHVLAVLYAGPLAQRGRPDEVRPERPGGTDMMQIEELDHDGRLRERGEALARDIVIRRWPEIERVAAALRERRELTGEEIVAAMGGVYR